MPNKARPNEVFSQNTKESPLCPIFGLCVGHVGLFRTAGTNFKIKITNLVLLASLVNLYSFCRSFSSARRPLCLSHMTKRAFLSQISYYDFSCRIACKFHYCPLSLIARVVATGVSLRTNLAMVSIRCLLCRFLIDGHSYSLSLLYFSLPFGLVLVTTKACSKGRAIAVPN